MSISYEKNHSNTNNQCAPLEIEATAKYKKAIEANSEFKKSP
jgi:hypothetical protein